MARTKETAGPRVAGLAVILALAMAAWLAGTPSSLASQEKSGAAQLPGPLSLAHSETPGANCRSCHAPDGKLDVSKCLACHSEIAKEPAAMKGFHRDKPGDCAVCHGEHQGRDRDLTGIDIKTFDHSETGMELKGAHRRVSDCYRCHRPEISFQRAKTRSYILKSSGCGTCHASPHPGRQDNCLACHNQGSWSVDWRSGWSLR